EGSIRRSADFAPTTRPSSKASSIIGFLLCFISFELTQGCGRIAAITSLTGLLSYSC
ncbi:hypothetical protein NL676_021370, partial [Syzygium grande]